jgi:hypothetical protein
MRILALAVLALAFLAMPAAGQQTTEKIKEKALPITREALLGKWEAKLGKTTVRIRFEKQNVQIEAEERQVGGGSGMGSSSPYQIDAKANVVRLGLGEGRLIKGGAALRVTLTNPIFSLPRGTILILSRVMERGAGK